MAVTITVYKDYTGICRKDLLWKQLIDIGGYRTLSAHVNSVREIERSSVKVRAEWYVTVGGVPYSWVQVDTLRKERMEISTRAVSGAFVMMKGKWTVTAHPPGRIRLAWSLTYELDPVIDTHCGDAVKCGMRGYMESMVAAHIRTAAMHGRNERCFKRVQLDRSGQFTIDGRSIDARLTSFSRGGVAFHLVKGMLDAAGKRIVRWCAEGVSGDGRLSFDRRSTMYRVAFERPLDEKEFRILFTSWADGCDFSDELISIYEVVSVPASTGIRIQAPVPDHT